jgi:hypothetical protein
MSDDDLIRRGDALYAIAGWEIPSTAIAALPAVTVGVTTEDIDALAYRFWSIHPKDIPEPIGMPEGYKGGRRAWFFAAEIRRILAALDLTPAPRRYMGQIMAECDCPREAECQAAGRCIAEGCPSEPRL